MLPKIPKSNDDKKYVTPRDGYFVAMGGVGGIILAVLFHMLLGVY